MIPIHCQERNAIEIKLIVFGWPGGKRCWQSSAASTIACAPALLPSVSPHRLFVKGYFESLDENVQVLFPSKPLETAPDTSKCGLQQYAS